MMWQGQKKAYRNMNIDGKWGMEMVPKGYTIACEIIFTSVIMSCNWHFTIFYDSCIWNNTKSLYKLLKVLIEISISLFHEARGLCHPQHVNNTPRSKWSLSQEDIRPMSYF